MNDTKATTDGPLDLRAYLDVLRRRWRLIVVVVAGCILVALGYSLSQTEKYRAEAELLLGPRGADSMFGGQDALTEYLNASRQIVNEVRALQSGTVQAAVEARYDGPLEPADISVGTEPVATDVVTVSTVAADAEAAAELVNLYVEVYVEVRREQRVDELLEAASQIQGQIDSLTERISEARQPLTTIEAQLALDPDDDALAVQAAIIEDDVESLVTPLENQRAVYAQQLDGLQLSAGIAESSGAEILTGAVVSDDPVSPRPVRNSAIALAFGLMVGVVAAFVRDNLDEGIRTLDDLQVAAPGVPVLAVVPRAARELQDHQIAARDDGDSPVGEGFRTLRTSMLFAGLNRPIRVLQVTSAVGGEGKTTTAANLAVVLAAGGERVVIVCTDLRRPRIQELFDVPVSPGLTDVLLQQADLGDAVRDGGANVRLITAGKAPPNPSELLSADLTASVVDTLATQSDIVVIDSTPVLPVADALVVSRMVDATVLVVDVRTTKRRMVAQALEKLEQVGAPVIGLVLNGADASDGYGYGGQYNASLERGGRRKGGRS